MGTFTTQRKYNYNWEKLNDSVFKNHYKVVQQPSKFDFDKCVCCNRKLNDKLPIRAVITNNDEIKPVVIVDGEYRVLGGVDGEDYKFSSIGDSCYYEYLQRIADESVFKDISKIDIEKDKYGNVIRYSYDIKEGERIRRNVSFMRAFYKDDVKTYNKYLKKNQIWFESFLEPKQNLIDRLNVLLEKKKIKPKSLDLDFHIHNIEKKIENY